MIASPEKTGLSIPLWLVWIAALGFIFAGLGSFAILDNNEGLYAEIPREMLASHDWRLWIIPHLNGLPYMEKPPLLYWLTALSFWLFGESEWSARLVPALSSVGCVALLLRFGVWVKRPQTGRLAALMFVSGVGVTAMSRVLMFDMLLTALLTAALMFAYRAATEGSPRLLRYAYAFLALALLAKGFVAVVLFGLVVLLFVLSTQRSFATMLSVCFKLFEPWAVMVFFAIAAPWHIAASLVEPIFAWFYFINEHVLRFLGKREPHDYYAGAWWYYLPRMAIYLFPWSFLLPALLTRSQRLADQDGVRLRRFLWLAWLLPLCFFSISSAKANYYLVAVMPFVAFHLALAIEDRNFLTPIWRAAPGLLIGVLALVLSLALASRGEQLQSPLIVAGMAASEFVFWALAALILFTFICAALAWRKERVGILVYVALPALIAIALSLVLGAIESVVSTRQIAQYLRSEQAGTKVYLYRNFEEKSSLPFYLKTPLTIIDARSNDLFWGNKLRGNEIVISAEQFALRSESQPAVVVVMDRQLKDFKQTAFFSRFKGEKRIGETTVFFN